MTTFAKLILTGLILIVGGIGAFMYATRPVAAPSSESIEQATSTSSGEVSTSTDSASATERQYRIASGSEVEFNIEEVLNGKDFTVVGTTQNVTGTVTVDETDPSKSVVGEIKINARTFKTDSERRDSAIARFILKSEEANNEFLVFNNISIKDVTSAKTAEGTATGELKATVSGTLTIAGVAKPVSFNVTATESADGKIKAVGQTTIKYKDFNITIPKVPMVASVEDDVILKIDATLEQVR